MDRDMRLHIRTRFILVSVHFHTSTQYTHARARPLWYVSPPSSYRANCYCARLDDFSRLASLRITAEMSPSVFHIADTFEQIGHTLRYEFDLVHLAGARTTIGTDYPITKTPNLLPPVAGLVGKVTVDPRVAKNPIVPEIHQGKTAEEISGPILCYLLTLGAAEAIGKEKTTGSIEVGKKANFVAFSHDLSRGEFKDAEVLQTWFEGRVVFSREALEEEARSL